MQFVDRYPIIVTADFTACRDFWAKHLSFAVIFENEWFVYMQAEGASIAFMSPDHPSSPPGPEPYTAGISMELEVADAPEGVKGDSANNNYKSVTMTTGLVVQAPLFIKTGERLRINTADGKYLSRA